MPTRQTNTIRYFLLAPLCALGLLVSACGGGADSSPDADPTADWPLAGATIGGDFTLADKNGEPVSWNDFAGQWRIVYFGYTYCPDVCPIDAAAIGGGLKKFEQTAPELAAKVTPIFVTVDPARDTPAVVGEFAAAFHPRMVGLTGTPEQIDAAAKTFRVFYEASEANEEGGYLVDHSRVTYLFDPTGAPVALLSSTEGPAKVAAELERWVR